MCLPVPLHLCERMGDMSKIYIEGGRRLAGEIRVHGAKNSALPALAATLLCRGVSVLHNCPPLLDVTASIRILEHLGCVCRREGTTVTVDSSTLTGFDIPDTLMREMRSSIVFLGAIAARCGQARLSFPGGCELGPRPIDLHLAALRQLGLNIQEDHGLLDCTVQKRLSGAVINLSIPSVGATENILLAAATAKGRTVIHNAAREPEISDLAAFLNRAGACIRGAGSSIIEIDGVYDLHGTEHTVIPDRIIAATYMAAAAVTGGDLILRDVEVSHLTPVLDSFRAAGCLVEPAVKSLRIAAPDRLKPVGTVRTMAYPGFPTDAQPPVLAMSALADGPSVFVENILENRFKYVDELARMGAKVKVEGRVAVVEGVPALSGATVSATDLRGGAALVIAALAASGVTEIDEIRHIDRGYADLENSLREVGANIKRE